MSVFLQSVNDWNPINLHAIASSSSCGTPGFVTDVDSDVVGGEVDVVVEGDGVPSGVGVGFGKDVEFPVTGGEVGAVVEGDGVPSGVNVEFGTAVEFHVAAGEVLGDDAPMLFVRYITSTTPTMRTEVNKQLPTAIARRQSSLCNCFASSASACLGSSRSSLS